MNDHFFAPCRATSSRTLSSSCRHVKARVRRTARGTTRQRLRIFVRDATHGALERGGGGSGWRWATWLSVLRARLLMSSFDLFFVVRSWWAGLKPHSRRNLG